MLVRKSKPARLFSLLMVLAMLLLALPLQAFAEMTAESRLARVDFSTAVELSPTFNPDTYTYSATIKSSENTITLTPFAMDSEVTIRVNGNQVVNGSASLPITLQQGGNIITVVVQSVTDPNSVKNYVFTIYRSSDLFNPDLKTLVVDGAELYQTFDPGKTSYTGRVTPSQAYVVVRPTAYDYSSIKVNGVSMGSSGYMLVNMATGINTITIEVTSQSGAIKTYSIQLNRPAPNDNADLSSIVIGGKTYTETGTTYVGYVPGNATSVNVVINASDLESTIDLDGQKITTGTSTNIYLKQDASDKFTITVTAPNGTTKKTYNLFIIRQNSTNTSNTGATGTGTSSGGTQATTTSPTMDSSGSINVTDGKGATALVTRSGGVRTYTVNLNTDSIKKLINDNGKASLLVVDYSKMTTVNDVLNLNIDGTLTALLQTKKIPVKLMALNGYLTVDLNKLNGWISGGSLSISRNNIGANFGKEYIPATGFINFSHSGSESTGSNPFNIEIPVFSDGDLKLANVYQYDGSNFKVIPSTTSGTAKKAAVGAGDYIVMNFKKSFIDINNHWSYNLLDFMSQKQIITGYPDDTFQPDRYVTRSEFTSMLVRAISDKQKTINAADEPFTDVSPIDWFYTVVNAGWKSGLVTGVTATTFAPDRNITREEMAAIAVRALKQLKAVSNLSSSQADSILNTYADAKDVSAWARGELATAINNKIMQGVGQNELASKDLATRAQAAVIVYNVLNQSSGF